MPETLVVEVVFATPRRQRLVAVELAPGDSVADALASSGLTEAFAEVDFGALQAGIWGRPVSPAHEVRHGDRVEFYRPLQRDPREARRELARAQRLGSSS